MGAAGRHLRRRDPVLMADAGGVFSGGRLITVNAGRAGCRHTWLHLTLWGWGAQRPGSWSPAQFIARTPDRQRYYQEHFGAPDAGP